MFHKPKQALFKQSLLQILRYTLVGVLTNFFAYALYLYLAPVWGAPKLAMTALYTTGALISFFANRRFTFRHDGHIGGAGVRYLLVQLSGYLLNLLLLVLFVDWMGFAHQIVQAVAIIVVAIFLFVLSRFFVFAPQSARNGVIRS